MDIPFTKPFLTGKELQYIQETYHHQKTSGNGFFTAKCHEWIQQTIGCPKALLTNSCTAALEMAAILIDIKPGDEVILPSYTFVSTANAFVLRGAIPVFVDIRPDTLNLDETKIESAITSKTKAIVPVHYAGVACQMDVIMAIAKKHNLFVIEDAAQGIFASYKNKPLGSFGHLAAFSFHDTKNIISGEGGALVINDPDFIERAEIIWEKGTNRSRFLRGEVDKYSWVDIGSSFLPSEITAAFLWAQLEQGQQIISARKKIWSHYYTELKNVATELDIRLPIVPIDCEHNGHLFYLLVADIETRSFFIKEMKKKKIQCVSHYVPLHDSIAGLKYGRAHGNLSFTKQLSDALVRLPLWVGLDQYMESVIESVKITLQSTIKTVAMDD